MSNFDVVAFNHRLINPLYQQSMLALEALAQASDHHWLAQQVRDRKLLTFLEYAPTPTLVQAMHALFYALTYSGTKEALCRLIGGLFGAQSVVILAEQPNALHISIKLQQNSLNYTLSDEHYALSERQYTQSLHSLSSIVGSNPLQFFKQFLPAGVVLTGLNITQ